MEPQQPELSSQPEERWLSPDMVPASVRKRVRKRVTGSPLKSGADLFDWELPADGPPDAKVVLLASCTSPIPGVNSCNPGKLVVPHPAACVGLPLSPLGGSQGAGAVNAPESESCCARLLHAGQARAEEAQQARAAKVPAAEPALQSGAHWKRELPS